MVGALNFIYRFFLKSRAGGEDLRRREFILNVFLVSSIILAIVGSVLSTINFFTLGDNYGGAPPYFVINGFLVFCYLFFLSRKGYSKLAAYLFTSLLLIITFTLSIKWGTLLPQATLMYALIVILSGILISSKTSFMITFLISTFLITVSYLQSSNLINYDSDWRQKIFDIFDTISASITLGIVAVASWLFNREINKALIRAKKSEKALKIERDSLEAKVEERTRDLKKVQMEKVLHLYRFADFGRITAGLFHDLVNPLTAISLNLEQLLTRSKGFRRKEFINTKSFIKQAILNTQHMERFVRSVRRQVQKQEVKKIFPLNEEVILAMNVLDHKAAEKQVKIHFIRGKLIKSYGNPTRFNQLVTNLVSNAIDACGDEKLKKRRKITIRLFEKGHDVVLIVQDSGCGIPRKNIKKIFDPFFTTKSLEEGTGIGLFICQDIVRKDLKGKMKVRSKKGQGTTFTVRFPARKVPVDKKI